MTVDLLGLSDRKSTVGTGGWSDVQQLLSLSFPGPLPPTHLSLPGPPIRTSAANPPLSTSAPGPPTSLSRPRPPDRTSLPWLPHNPSRFCAPTSRSSPPRPTMPFRVPSPRSRSASSVPTMSTAIPPHLVRSAAPVSGGPEVTSNARPSTPAPMASTASNEIPAAWRTGLAAKARSPLRISALVDVSALDQECDPDVGAVFVEVLAPDSGRDDVDGADVSQRALSLAQRLLGGVIGRGLRAADQLDDLHYCHSLLLIPRVGTGSVARVLSRIGGPGQSGPPRFRPVPTPAHSPGAPRCPPPAPREARGSGPAPTPAARRRFRPGTAPAPRRSPPPRSPTPLRRRARSGAAG